MLGCTKREIGFIAEDAVIDHLKRAGYRLIVRNYSIHNIGELDAVMEKDGTVYVIEIKSRQLSEFYPSPGACITPAKMRKVRRTTAILIRRYELYDSDIVFLAGCVYHDRWGNILDIEIVPIV